MSKVRLEFQKGEEVRYISHLDLMRTFARALKRAQLPVKYSQGFNPHPLLSIAFPLSVGITGDEEYLDMEVTEGKDIQNIISTLNSNLPKGLYILDGEYTDNNNYLDNIQKAEYGIKIICVKLPENISKSIEDILEKDTLEIEKKGKKKGRKVLKSVNIRPDILDINIEDIKDNIIYCKGILSAGKAKTLNPNLFTAALEKYVDGLEIDYTEITRHKLL